MQVQTLLKHNISLYKLKIYPEIGTQIKGTVHAHVPLEMDMKEEYAVHLRTKINDNKMMFEFQKQDDRRRNHNKQSRNSSI